MRFPIWFSSPILVGAAHTVRGLPVFRSELNVRGNDRFRSAEFPQRLRRLAHHRKHRSVSPGRARSTSLDLHPHRTETIQFRNERGQNSHHMRGTSEFRRLEMKECYSFASSPPGPLTSV